MDQDGSEGSPIAQWMSPGSHVIRQVSCCNVHKGPRASPLNPSNWMMVRPHGRQTFIFHFRAAILLILGLDLGEDQFEASLALDNLAQYPRTTGQRFVISGTLSLALAYQSAGSRESPAVHYRQTVESQSHVSAWLLEAVHQLACLEGTGVDGGVLLIGVPSSQH